jgi:membrane protein DedA with SNARE-associated domain
VLASYAGIFVAAVVESEAVLAAASVAVRLGKLNGLAVLVFGALGGSTGDQIVFYALRGHIDRLLAKFPFAVRRRPVIVERFRTHGTWVILAGRFLPGLRSTIAASAAAAGMRPAWFSFLNIVSSFLWAATVMLLVIHGGGWWERWSGLPRPIALAMPAVFVIAFFYFLGRLTNPDQQRPSGRE